MALPAEAATSARRDVVPILVEDTARDALRVMPTAGARDRRRRDR